VITSRFVQPGEAIAAGAPVVSIADLTRTRVEAEVDEFDAGRIHAGASATITAEGYEGTWQGRVEEIPDSVTTRRLKPQDTSKPVDTRVLLVKVALNEATPLKLAQRVEIEFSTK
jgi:multidrug resistance efflux pump